jgi:protein-arginine kinase activator protein McsA
MKTCTKCNQQKSLDQFGNLKKSKDGYNTICKKCMRLYYNNHYNNNPIRKKQIRKNDQIRKDKFKLFKRKYFETHFCVDCDANDFRILDFDHLGDKEFNISDGIMRGYAFSRILKEIEKCEVVCANCHRIRTWERSHMD